MQLPSAIIFINPELTDFELVATDIPKDEKNVDLSSLTKIELILTSENLENSLSIGIVDVNYKPSNLII